ncbi:MAG: heme ABC transporter permease [Pelagibacterales bacterium]|nr:heme ABC transporter permease [Pelagibacterales bacterium]
MFDLQNPKTFFNFSDQNIFWLKVIFFLTAIVGLVFSLFISPQDYLQQDAVRIMYVHVPASWISLFIFAVISFSSFLSLIFKIRVFSVYAKSLAPIGLVFAFISLSTGSLWGYPTWGTFWTWDARLTSMLILFFTYVLYVVLWKWIKNYFLAEKITNIVGIIGFINLPIIKYSVDWWNTLHQPSSITIYSAPTIHTSMLFPLLVMFFSFCILSLLIFLMRYKYEIISFKNSRYDNRNF